jgi:hypothetical protein
MKENEEIKSRSNAVRVHAWLEGIRSNNSVAGGKRRFFGMDKTQSHNHSERDLENNERKMMTITSPVNQKTNFNVDPGNCQRDPDVKMLLARQILGLDLPKFSGEDAQRMTLSLRRVKRWRECKESKARQCVKMVLLTNNAERVIEIRRRNYGNSDVILNQLIEEVKQQCPVTESIRHFQEFANADENLFGWKI